MSRTPPVIGTMAFTAATAPRADQSRLKGAHRLTRAARRVQPVRQRQRTIPAGGGGYLRLLESAPPSSSTRLARHGNRSP